VGHALTELGSATLDSYGGLFTNANPQDLPEGASPRCQDCDFIVGAVMTRPGLQSVYTFATTLSISAVTEYNGIATFSYTGITPTVNEGFLLSGFNTIQTFPLNGQTVFVISVNAAAGTFTAAVTIATGTYTGLSATATSVSGQFLGPNIPTQAVSVGTGNTWVNPQNIMGVIGYASVISGTPQTSVQIPQLVTELDAGNTAVWNGTNNIITTGPGTAQISFASGQSQRPLVAYSGTLNIPANAIVSGVQVSVQASSTAAGIGSLNVQLINGNTFVPYGTPVKIPLGTTLTTYTAGSPSYQWGTLLNAAELNGVALGVQLTVSNTSGIQTTTILANSLSIAVTYSLAGGTATLNATGFVFAVPLTAGVTGFGVTFQAYTSNASFVNVQLLKNGIPVGQPVPQALTTVPTIYEVGGAGSLFGSTWLASDVNNVQFGVQITASGNGTTNLNDLDMLTFISPSLVNFNYVKSYIQNNNQTYTLALDASGILWQEDVTNNPGILTTVLSGILPGSFANSVTADNNEYILFSNLAIGTDRPRVYYRGQSFLPLSQGGPGAPPQVSASQNAIGTQLAVTAYSTAGNIVTFTFTVSTTPAVNALYKIAGTGNAAFDNKVFTVVGTPAPSTTQFSAAFIGTATPPSASGLTATANPTNTYDIVSIVQNGMPAPNGQIGSVFMNGQEVIWSAQGNYKAAGTNVRMFYAGANAPSNLSAVAQFNNYPPMIVTLTGNCPVLGNGTFQVVDIGTAVPTAGAHQQVPYLDFTFASSGLQVFGSSSSPGSIGFWQQTLATITLQESIPGLVAGSKITVAGVSVPSWNGTYTIIEALNSCTMSITSTQMDANGLATFGFIVTSIPTSIGPTVGQTVQIQNTTGGNGAFNTIGVISAVIGATFQVSGYTAPVGGIPFTNETNGTAQTFGTQFTFDPGVANVGTTTSSIFGNVGAGGTVSAQVGANTPIGQGTRQLVVYFITTSGFETPVSSPVTFTTTSNATAINISQIPIGPPDTVARGFAITEAGQNGVPGANFYTIEQAGNTVIAGVATPYTSTIIQDNTTTAISLSWLDAVLLNSREVDVQGDNLFNLIELGSSAWAVQYSSRMFYGLQLNKINNWQSGGSLAFDGGYLSGKNQPLGWSLINTIDQTLLSSPVTGQALYIKNQSTAVPNTIGMIYQTAFQDAYGVAILQPNLQYSVRVAASIPSGNTVGSLVIDFTDGSTAGSFGTTYGSFTVPFSSMTTNVAVFTGIALAVPFVNTVSPLVKIRVYGQNMAVGADCLVDRIEVFETKTPYLVAQVYGSYVNSPESIDGSATGGIIDTTTENSQAVVGGFVMHDLLFLLKTSSWYSTQENPNSEPGGWGLHEVSNKVGAIGINSYDTGEEWCITACRSGIYGFDGGQPTKISQELWNLWEQINWKAGDTIVLRNDVVSKRLYVAIPLPTGVNIATGIPANKYTNVWLPNAPYNPAPTTPNVILMLNYQGLADIKEMMMSPGVHTTMFGTLAAPDMKRKWTIWNIATPYMQFIMQPDGESTPIYICNGIASSKIYTLNAQQYSDDGVAIHSLYTTYGFVNASKAATLPVFGFHAKRYTVFQTSITGGQTDTTSNGNAQVRMLPNTLTPRYPYTVPVGIPLSDPVEDDFFRPINVKGNRMFVEVSTNASGSFFNLSKMILTGKADPWSSLNPVGGGNAGVV
jgi:hypothetical protein